MSDVPSIAFEPFGAESGIGSNPSVEGHAVNLPRRRLTGALLILLLGVIALAILQLRESPSMKSLGENRTTLSRDGTSIAFTKMGSGPALVIVDGAFCFRENGPASELAPLLARHFTVYAYDRRGRGESGNGMPYAIEREVEDLGAIVHEAGGSAVAFGISSGGGLVLQAASRGVNLTKLALYEPPYLADNGQPRAVENPRDRLQQFIAAGDRNGAVKFFLADVMSVPRPFVHVMPFLMRSVWKKNVSVAHTLSYDLTILADRSVLMERRSSISMPVLVLGGEDSPAQLRMAVSTVGQAFPNARCVFLKGLTHKLSAPVVSPVLVDFFETK